jgi:hypothetical protein
MNRFAIPFLCLISATSWAATNKVVGQLGLVQGEVFVDSKAVQKSAVVYEGSVVEVKKGRATLILGKGSVFNLAADSKMVVNQYIAKTDTTQEGAELDLKFGRTRALILNQGAEKKDIKIKARAATMGVRGTEIFINAPRDSAKPIQFFTLEGKAVVNAHPGAPFVAVAQNEGVSTSGVAPTTSANAKGTTTDNANSGKKEAPAAAPIATAQAGSAVSDTKVVSMNVAEVNAEIKKAELDNPKTLIAKLPDPLSKDPAGFPPIGDPGNPLPRIIFDPIQDKATVPLMIRPKFCNAAATGSC